MQSLLLSEKGEEGGEANASKHDELKTKNKKTKHKQAISTAAAAGGGAAGAGAVVKKLTCRCVMAQDNGPAAHRAGYTALFLDPRRGGLIGVTADHNLVLLGTPSTSSSSTSDGVSYGVKEGVAGGWGGGSCLVTRRQIVGYNDEVIDIKSLPGSGVEGSSWRENGESWVAVATNSPQVCGALMCEREMGVGGQAVVVVVWWGWRDKGEGGGEGEFCGKMNCCDW